MAEDVNQGREILTYTKPSIDIFMAIFASDDEDDDESDDDEAPSRAVNGQRCGHHFRTNLAPSRSISG